MTLPQPPQPDGDRGFITTGDGDKRMNTTDQFDEDDLGMAIPETMTIAWHLQIVVELCDEAIEEAERIEKKYPDLEPIDVEVLRVRRHRATTGLAALRRGEEFSRDWLE